MTPAPTRTARRTEPVPRQLTFDWPRGVALGAEDFFTAPANAQAYAMVTTPAGWPERKLVLTGPAGSGKSHLARVFAAQTGAVIREAATLAEGDLPGTPVVVEDMEGLPAALEPAMFHLHNHLRGAGLPLLMTARTPPGRWLAALPDLASRMQAATIAAIAEPDDALLAAVLMKLFADRQIMPKPELMDYLLRRMERSFAAARDIVAALDAASMNEGHKINTRLAGRLLDNRGPKAR